MAPPCWSRYVRQARQRRHADRQGYGGNSPGVAASKDVRRLAVHTGGTVGLLAQDVCVSDVPRGLFDHVDVDPAQRHPAQPPLLTRGGLAVDTVRRLAYRNGERLGLSRKELAVLEILLAADGAVVSAEELLDRAWDENTDPFTNVVRMTMSKLRRKLGDPPVIHTMVGAGYQIP